MIRKVSGEDRKLFYTDYDMNLLSEKKIQYLNYAPYYILENALSKEQVSELSNILSRYDSSAKKGTVIGLDSERSVKDNYRNSDIFFVRAGEDSNFERYNDIIIDITQRVNDNIFKLNLNSTMDPQYTIYSEGMYFDWHPDGPFGVMDGRGLNCIPDNLRWRKLSCVTSLTPESSYQGGDFQIISTSGHPSNCVHTIRLDAGSMLFFPAYASHRVAPVTSGIRKTLVHWFCGPRWR